ncbi:hypothetical protein [Stutzerimonas tarimensis]|uniref:Phage tail protein n=1 Tax=Stutzerimonas tarimensis TaxID=1507735 RepID=A0ABV7T742_9GAMM
MPTKITWIVADGYSYTEYQLLPGSSEESVVKTFRSHHEPLYGPPVTITPVNPPVISEPAPEAEPS